MGRISVRVETPPLVIRSENTVYWRIRALREGRYNLIIQNGDQAAVKTLVVGPVQKTFSSSRVRGQAVPGLLFPAEKSLPSTSFVKRITVRYPQKAIHIGTWRLNWLVLFFVFSMAVGFALKGVFRVEI